MVHLGTRMETTLLARSENQQPQRQRAERQQSLFGILFRIYCFQMLDDSQLRSIGVGRINDYEVWAKVRLELGGRQVGGPSQ